MNILFASSEAVPFAKTGGLADVSSSLPSALSRLGHTVRLIIPAYREALQSGIPIEDLGIEFEIPIGNKMVKGSLLESRLPGSEVPVILVRQDHYYDRSGIYNFLGEDFSDNCERFVFFSRAVLETIELLKWEIDILHSNDWQTGLVPVYQDVLYREKPRYARIATLHTIHNLAYQGVFWHWDMMLTGIDWKYFTFDKMEFYGKLNLLKSGIVFAKGISTVSPRYAAEIQTPEYGCGLEPVLQYRHQDLRGILNGIDTDHWNPVNDKYLAAPFSTADVFEKKPLCKAALQQTMQLPLRPEVPIFAMVGRLAYQKGVDLILETIPDWVQNHGVQYCILGTGDRGTEERFRELQQQFPENLAIRLEFSDALAHQIEAGADMFLMPSRYEPCGLNQMYSQLYGTVPIVRETGGLADTVIDVEEGSIAGGTANGFSFSGDWPHDFNRTIWRALHCYLENPALWRSIMLNGMRQDRSWANSAKHYVDYYEELLVE